MSLQYYLFQLPNSSVKIRKSQYQCATIREYGRFKEIDYQKFTL